MEKRKFSDIIEFEGWYEDNQRDYYMYGEKPKEFPCLVFSLIIRERNCVKDTLSFEAVYIKDFEDV